MSSFRPISQYSSPSRTLQMSQIPSMQYSQIGFRASTIMPMNNVIPIQPMTTIVSYQPVQIPRYYQLPTPMIPVRQILVESPEKKEEVDEDVYRRLEEELDAWRRKYFALEAIHQRCAGYLEHIDHQDERIKILREDNRRINFALREKINEYEQLRVNFCQIDIENHDLRMAKLEFQRSTELLFIRSQELEESRKACTYLENQLQSLQNAAFTLAENEVKIQQQQEEIDLWKSRYAQLDQDRTQELLDQKKSSEDLKNSQYQDLKKNGDDQKGSHMNEVRNLRAQVERLTQDNLTLKKKLHDLEILSYEQIANKQELESKLKQVRQLYERVSEQLSEKIKHNEQLKIDDMRRSNAVAAS